MKLMTQELYDKIPPLRSMDSKKPKDIPIIVKFFDPVGSWTWYAYEGGKVDGDYHFFGYVRGTFNELGYFSLKELESIVGHFSLGIERDLHFGKHSLAEAMERQI